MSFYVGFPLIVMGILAVCSAPFWTVPLWKAWSPTQLHEREKVRVAGAILDGLTAHYIERPDLWNVTPYQAICRDLGAEVWVANGVNYIRFKISDEKTDQDAIPRSARRRFFDVYKGRKSEAHLAQAKETMERIEKSINARRDNVVRMKA